MGGEVASGAIQGAASGASFGPVGAIIGGIIGAIGGIFQASANKAKRQAKAEQIRAQEREAAVQRRDLIRGIRIARAQAVAAAASESGGLESSAPQGAIGSIRSQGNFATNYFDAQVASGRRVNSLIGQADRYSAISESISSFIQLAGAFKGGFGTKSLGTFGSSLNESRGGNVPRIVGTVA